MQKITFILKNLTLIVQKITTTKPLTMKAKIKIEAEIEFDEDTWYSHSDEEELEWFTSLLNDKENTMIILHSNDVGDTIGETYNFKWEIIREQ